MAHRTLLPQSCSVRKYSFSISQKTKALCSGTLWGTEEVRAACPAPSLRNHLLPLSSDPGSDLQSLEERETKGWGPESRGRNEGTA